MKQDSFALTMTLIMLVTMPVFAQEHDQFFVSFNTNSYRPWGNTQKGAFPLVHYDKKAERKLSIGGFGAGVFILRKHNEKFFWKGQANVSKYKYWDVGSLKDDQNRSLGVSDFTSTDISLALATTAHRALGRNFSVGAGLGVQVLLVSYIDPRSFFRVSSYTKLTRNNYYKPVMPVLPVEFSFRPGKFSLTLRYEQALLNRIRGDLAKVKSETFGLAIFEAGYRLR
jgi:hypothetical protein